MSLMPSPVRDAQGRPLDVIELAGITVDCIVGVYARERQAPQPLQLDCALYLDTRDAAHGGALGRTVHYGRLAAELRFLLESCRFELLESAAEALCRYVLAPPTQDAPRAQVREVTVRLTKPHALQGHGVPSLTVHRTGDELAYTRESKPFGEVDVIHEGTGYGIYRLRIRPGGTIPTHVHRVMDEAELVLGQGLLLQGQPVARGTALRWPRHFAHRYDNPTATEQTVLCVDRPRFQPDDEVEVEPPAGGLEPPEGRPYYPPHDGGLA